MKISYNFVKSLEILNEIGSKYYFEVSLANKLSLRYSFLSHPSQYFFVRTSAKRTNAKGNTCAKQRLKKQQEPKTTKVG